MKRTIIFFFFLFIIFSSCGKKYETDEAIELYRNNESEFINIFKMLSMQDKIKEIGITSGDFKEGKTKVVIKPYNKIDPESGLPFRLEIYPDFSSSDEIDIDEEEISLLKDNNLIVNDVILYCKFLSKYEDSEINILGELNSSKPNTVRFELNPYQGFTFEPNEPFPYKNRQYFELSENIYYYTEL